MFELIQANKKKSVILFLLMGVFLIALGYFIGAAMFPPNGGVIGAVGAVFIWLFLSSISYFSGDKILLMSSGAKEVTHDIHPMLFNIVEEMKIASGLSSMPKIYIIDNPAPNAFATGVKPERCAVAVTAGLLNQLNRDELQGVIAHEISHILNRDVLFMTMSGIMLGSIVLISHTFFRSMLYGGGRRFRSSKSSQGAGQAQAVIMIVAVLLAILAPIVARIIYFAISRKREYLADASAARLTRYPDGLASALEKISANTHDLKSANKVTAPMYILNPLKDKGQMLSNLSSTHPPITKRIQILRKMSHGAGFDQYQEAFSEVTGKVSPVVPVSELNSNDDFSIREKSADLPGESKKSQKRDLNDLMRAVNNYAFLTCICGLKFKIPPNYTNSDITCPRCENIMIVPLLDFLSPEAINQIKQDKSKEKDESQQVYNRSHGGWHTFNCNCGHRIQLSPAFATDRITCKRCERVIQIK